MLIDILRGVKRIAQQNKPKKMMVYKNMSFVNWWKEKPEEDWFTRFVNHHFPQCETSIHFYSVFGPRYKLRAKVRGIKIFYSGENLEPYFECNGIDGLKSAEIYRKWRNYSYRNYAVQDMDISLGMSRSIVGDNYLRFPEWIPFIFAPESSKEDIEDRVREINDARPNPNARNAVLLASHDDYGTRERICRGVEKVIPITYSGKWRNNSTDLWEKYADNKREYLKNFRFNICPENVDAPGYCTEKIFDAFLSGTIPIYHGDRNNPEPGLINKDAVIFWDYKGDNSEQLTKLKRLITDQHYYEEFMKQPKLTDETVEFVYNKMQDLKRKLKEAFINA